MTVSIQGVPAEIASAIQNNTLERVFHDALFPRLLYRSEATAEPWAANLGERMIFTRAGLIVVNVTPLVPGSDPTPKSYGIEQWEVEAAQYGDTIDTHMPTSNVAIAPTFMRNTTQLGENAGETLNRLVRDKLFRAYLGGSTNLAVAATAGQTSIQVASINGFTETLLNARPAPVSAGNPIAALVGAEAVSVVGATPLNPLQPFGRGVLFLAAALGTSPAIRTAVKAVNRSTIVRSGGATSVDGLSAMSILTLQDVINAVTQMRTDKVPPCPDGYYHVHLTPTGEGEIFQDAMWQRLFTALPDSMAYRDLAIGQLLGCRFYRDTENPNPSNVGALVASGNSAQGASEIGGDVYNSSGVEVRRAIVIGGGAIYEKYLDESKYITDAGVQGKIGSFNVTNNGVQVMTNRIRYILRSPQDRLQQIVSQTWSWSGDFAIPSDSLTTGPARFKRAVIIEHA